MIKFLRNRSTRKEEDPSPAQVPYKLFSREYGVKDLRGETVWFSDDSSGHSLSEALWYLDSFNKDEATLMSRLVSHGREEDHVRLRP